MDVRKHADDFQLGADIFLYAIDKQNLLKKGQTYLVVARSEDQDDRDDHPRAAAI